jgi:hypothetical protein
MSCALDGLRAKLARTAAIKSFIVVPLIDWLNLTTSVRTAVDPDQLGVTHAFLIQRNERSGPSRYGCIHD